MRLFASAEERKTIGWCRRLRAANTRDEIVGCFRAMGESAVAEQLAQAPEADVYKHRDQMATLMEGSVFAGRGFVFSILNK
jgi:hypothetical protein